MKAKNSGDIELALSLNETAILYHLLYKRLLLENVPVNYLPILDHFTKVLGDILPNNMKY